MSKDRIESDARPGLIEAIVVFIVAWWGLRYLWRFLPHMSNPMAWPWLQHLWFAFIAAAWCVFFQRRFPIGKPLEHLESWKIPALVTLCVSVGALLFLYFTPVRPMLGKVFSHDPQALFFQLVAPGLGEEVLFRGFIQTSLNRTLRGELNVGPIRFGIGTLAASIIFGVAHLGNGFPLPLLLSIGFFATLVGLGLGIGYERTGNLWIAVILHNVLNLTNIGIAVLLPGIG